MTTSQDTALTLAPAEVDDNARIIFDCLRQEISAYRVIAGSVVEAEVLGIVKRNLELYLRTLRTESLPEAAELVEFEEVCGRRLRQGFPLEAVMRAGRREILTMWELARARLPADRLPALTSLTLQYLDAVNAASERGYVHAREDFGRSQMEATRLFLTRLMQGNFADEAEASAEAALLGLDLGPFRVGVVVGPDGGHIARSEADLHLARVAGELSGVLPETPWGLVESGLVLAAPATSPGALAEVVERVLRRPASTGPRLVAGLGAPRVGSSGLKASFAEARRALALGSVLNPGDQVHRYDELRVFDLFKEDGTVESFVEEVLGPLLHQARRRAQMIQTLDAFFSCGMVRKAAASRLQIHPNTLDYRLREIESAVGSSVRSGSAAFRVQLAVKLLPLAQTAVGLG